MKQAIATDTLLAIAQHHEEICRTRIVALDLAVLRLTLELERAGQSFFDPNKRVYR